MTAKFTPGPWKISKIVDLMIYPEDGKTPICLIAGMFHRETKYANARLIAKSPTMFDALKCVAALLTTWGLTDVPPEAITKTWGMINELIAEIEGEIK